MATCRSCGGPVADLDRWCSTCGAALPSPAPPEAPPLTPAAAVGYASIGDRMLAALLDVLVLGAAFWALGMWVAPRYGGLTPEGFNLLGAPALLVMGLSTLLFLAYCVCLEWWLGATLGKVAVGARVAGADGGSISFRQSLIRNLFRLIDGIGVYLVAGVAALVTRRRQRLGDLVAGTVVTRHDFPRSARAVALLALVALPLAAIAGTWSLRAAPTGETRSVGSTSSTGGQSTQSVGTGQIAARGTPALQDVADGPLTLSALRFAAGKDGPERPDATFGPGDTPTLLFEIKGFAIDEAQKGRIRLTIGGRDPDGVPIHEPKETEAQPHTTGAPLESWANASLPDYAVPGEYKLDITVVDLVGNRKVAVSAPFKVKGEPFEPSESLVFRNVRLTEGEDGPARGGSTYAAGGTVWMAFDAVGFKAAPDKTIRLQEQMTVTSASGEKALDGQVLDLNRQFFYIPRRLPITNHITLGQIPPGDYQAVLTLTDGVGTQRCEQVVRFTIQ